MGDQRQKGALGGLDLGNAGGAAVRLELLAPQTHLNIRGRPGDESFKDAVHGALGMHLPEGSNRYRQSGQVRVAWLGPDEWLILAPENAAEDIEARLLEANGDDPWMSVVDVSHNYTGFRLVGPAAADVLSKGCPLDLHPRVFGPGDCAQSLLAQTRILLLHAGSGRGFEVRVRNSFARYTAHWLVDAMAEFRDT